RRGRQEPGGGPPRPRARLSDPPAGGGSRKAAVWWAPPMAPASCPSRHRSWFRGTRILSPLNWGRDSTSTTQRDVTSTARQPAGGTRTRRHVVSCAYGGRRSSPIVLDADGRARRSGGQLLELRAVGQAARSHAGRHRRDPTM